jgi:D-alanine-D-alanine ligase
VLPLILIDVPRGFYDYQAKYQAEDTRYHCPAPIAAALTARINTLARSAFELLGCHGWGRVDFMLDEKDEPYVLELNTVPGMTDHSLVPMAAKQAGIDFDDLVLRILETGDMSVRGVDGKSQLTGVTDGVR